MTAKMCSDLARERKKSVEIPARPNGSVGFVVNPKVTVVYMYSDQLSDYLRMVLLPTVRFRQFCDARDHSDKPLGSGQSFYWNVYSKVQTGGGKLLEHQKMKETKFTITQGSGTVYEYGNSVPYTGLLDDLSLQPVKEVIDQVLKIDATETLDYAAWEQFDAASAVLSVGPTSGNSSTAVTLDLDGMSTANNLAMNKAHVGAIVSLMKERNIPGYFENGDYGCIARPTTFDTLESDLEGIHQYVTPGFDMIRNGEKGRYRGVRFFEQTAIASEGWSNAKSDAAYFFGADTVHEAIVIPEEMRGKIPGDFGRDKGVAWYYLGGFKLVHSTSAQARIMKWDSAS